MSLEISMYYICRQACFELFITLNDINLSFLVLVFLVLVFKLMIT